MFEEERLQMINQYIQTHSRASVSELCELLDVSESTVRRDLKELEIKGALKRTHGGAVFPELVSSEPTFTEKEDKYRREKEMIAKKAAEMIEEGDSLLIDSGTTTMYLSAQLLKFRSLTVVTNSIILAQQLSSHHGIQIILTGGTLRQNTMSLVGPIAEDSLEKIRVDKAFIATNGIDAKFNLTTPNIVEASIKKKMIGCANEVIVLADNSKIGYVSFAKFANISEVNSCITGAMLSKDKIRELESKGLKIYLAGI